MAGVPQLNAALYHRIRFLVGDPAALIQLPAGAAPERSILIVRDIEMERAGRDARADRVACPADFAPDTGLSGDRETATAQAAAECLRRCGVRAATADRTLPLIYAEVAHQAGIRIECDFDLGVEQRRCKDEQEIAWLRESQRATESAMEMACRTVARATANERGELIHAGSLLSAERLRAMIDHHLLDLGYVNPPAIVACGPQGADCHNLGSGPLRTGLPVIIDIFPRNRSTLYHGDCTRTVVHGEIPDAISQMHAVVVAAKKAATSATKPAVTGEQVHRATVEVIERHGYGMGLPSEAETNGPQPVARMPHGTGHGIGLEVHEPPLLDRKGPALIPGDALTIEPGLYRRDLGGVRVEDMVIVTDEGCMNLNQLPEGLCWSE